MNPKYVEIALWLHLVLTAAWMANNVQQQIDPMVWNWFGWLSVVINIMARTGLGSLKADLLIKDECIHGYKIAYKADQERIENLQDTVSRQEQLLIAERSKRGE